MNFGVAALGAAIGGCMRSITKCTAVACVALIGVVSPAGAGPFELSGSAYVSNSYTNALSGAYVRVTANNGAGCSSGNAAENCLAAASGAFVNNVIQPGGYAASGVVVGSDPTAPSGASGSADLSSGNLVVNSWAIGNFASATAVIWETIYFSGAQPGAQVTVHMTGTANSTAAASAGAGIDFQAGLPSAFFGYGVGCGSNAITNGTYDITATRSVQNSTAYTFMACLNAGNGAPGVGGFTDAFISDPIFFDLPQGVTFTSASGIFLQTPHDGIGVPEPFTLSIFGTGLAGAFAMRRRKPRRL